MFSGVGRLSLMLRLSGDGTVAAALGSQKPVLQSHCTDAAPRSAEPMLSPHTCLTAEMTDRRGQGAASAEGQTAGVLRLPCPLGSAWGACRQMGEAVPGGLDKHGNATFMYFLCVMKYDFFFFN